MTQIEGLQRDQATEMLREALAGRTYDAAQLSIVSSQELTSAFGRRRVVQYIVEGLDPTGPAQLIAKTFSESHRRSAVVRASAGTVQWTVRLRKVPRTSATGLPSGAELGAVSSVHRGSLERIH